MKANFCSGRDEGKFLLWGSSGPGSLATGETGGPCRRYFFGALLGCMTPSPLWKMSLVSDIRWNRWQNYTWRPVRCDGKRSEPGVKLIWDKFKDPPYIFKYLSVSKQIPISGPGPSPAKRKQKQYLSHFLLEWVVIRIKCTTRERFLKLKWQDNTAYLSCH